MRNVCGTKQLWLRWCGGRFVPCPTTIAVTFCVSAFSASPCGLGRGRRLSAFWVMVWLVGVLGVRAWDYEGHRLVNQLALDSLPTNFPAFVFAADARERIAFLAGEPDRWRSSAEPPLRHVNHVDHYFDIDLLPLYRIDPGMLTPFRYEFM